MKKVISLTIAALLALCCPLCAFAVSGSDASSTVSFTEELGQTLTIMGQGMVGIFIVMIFILIVTVILNRATSPDKAKNKKKDQ